MSLKTGMGRRDLILGGAAAAAAGLAAMARPRAAFGTPALPAAGAWPWPGKGLDPARTAGAPTSGLSGCGEVSFGLIARRLKEVMPGSAWAAVPPQLAGFANGGGPYGSDCGALQGPLLAMSLVGAPLTLRQEFYKWYCDFSFPSPEWDDLYPFKNTLRTVAHSPHCHESRMIWHNAYLEQAAGGKPDDTRCPKLTRDCVKKAVELLNAHKLAKYAGAWAPDESYKACYDCHSELAAQNAPGGLRSGKEDCVRCHACVEPHGE